MSIELNKLAAEFNRYFTSSNGVDVPERVSVSRDEWRVLFTAIQQAESEPVRPDILEKLTYHQFERDDLSLGDCLDYLASGWKNVHGRTDRQMVMQILALLAEQPAHPATGVPDGWSDRHKRVAAFALRLFADAAWDRSDEAAQKNYIGNHGDYKAFQTDAEDAEEARSILLAASPAQKGGE